MLKKKLDKALRIDEIWWRQRVKSLWLKEGDKNTKKNHLKASHRKRKNYINFIHGEDGYIYKREENIFKIFPQHFNNIYKASDLDKL